VPEPEKLKPGEKDRYEVKPVDVTLERGNNLLRVRAVNDGGEGESDLVAVTKLAEPVRVVIKTLTAGGTEYPPQGAQDGKLSFRPLDDSQVEVRGEVSWGPENDAQLTQPRLKMRVFINGVQQLGTILDAPAGKQRVRTFKTQVLLTRDKDNQILIRLPTPSLKKDDSSYSECRVDCRKPATELHRMAHLLVVDVEDADEKAVRKRVLQAIDAEPVPGTRDRFTRAGFADGGQMYGPLYGSWATPQRVCKLLHDVSENLNRRARMGAVNDLVIIYYRGGETADAQDHLLKAGGAGGDPISFKELTARFSDNLGAQIVLLDVDRVPEQRFTEAVGLDQVTRWSYDPHVSLMRYSWWDQPKARDQGAYLLTDLEDALSKKSRLGEVREQIDGKFKLLDDGDRWDSKKYGEKLIYDRYMSSGQQDLLIGARR